MSFAGFLCAGSTLDVHIQYSVTLQLVLQPLERKFLSFFLLWRTGLTAKTDR